MLSNIRDILRSKPAGTPQLGYHFRQWYARPLTRAQEAILTVLEKQRTVDRVAPYIMIDDPVGSDEIRRFLEAYTLWFSTEAYSVKLPAVIVSTEPTVRFKTDIRRVSYGSMRGLQGHSYFAALLLDVDRWCPGGSLTDKFERNLPIISGMLTRSNPRNLLIIHGNTQSYSWHDRHLNTYCLRYERLLGMPDVTPVLSLDTLTTSLPQYRAYRKPQQQTPPPIEEEAPPHPRIITPFLPPQIAKTKFLREAAAAPAA